MNIDVTIFHWIVFNASVFGLLAIDLLYFHYYPHRATIKEAILTSVGWISLALLFNVWIYFRYGQEPGLAFLTGYLLEKSLSVDNLFVFLLIFSHFKVPPNVRHKVLFYGILGAIFMRAALIWGGIVLVNAFSWIFYVFGLFLIYTGLRLAFKEEEKEIQHEKHIVYRLLSKCIPMTHFYHDGEFFVRKNGELTGTPLLVALILIETTDLIFALDSVPAILGITTDPFIVYTSNIFAILGLRSLFFVLEGMMESFYLLHYALAAILVFIGTKMLLIKYVHIPITITLAILVALLTLAIVGSFLFPRESKIHSEDDDSKSSKPSKSKPSK